MNGNRNGCRVTDVFKKKIQAMTEAHLGSVMHREAIDICSTGPTPVHGQMRLTHDVHHAALASLIRASMSVVRDNQALANYELRVLDRSLEGVPMGERLHSRKTCRAMILMAHKVGLRDLTTFVSTPSPFTRRKPRVGVSADKVTDKSKKSFQVVNVRVNYFGTPVSLFLDARRIHDNDSYEEDVDAGGFSLFNKIEESLAIVGLSSFEISIDPDFTKTPDGRIGKGSPVLVRYMDKDKQYKGRVETVHRSGTYTIRYEDDEVERQVNEDQIEPLTTHNLIPAGPGELTRQVNSYAFDGEAAYQGLHKGMAHYIQSSEDGLGDKDAVITVDPPHCAQTAISNGLASSVLLKVRGIIRSIYGFFSKSTKRQHVLQEFADLLDMKLQQLHTYFKVLLCAVIPFPP